MKICTKCDVTKPLSDFRVKSGRSYSHCKACEYAYNAAYRKTPQGRRMKQEADRRYAQSRKGIKVKRAAKRRYKRTDRGRLKAEEYRCRLRNKDPARLRARMAVHHAVAAGVLCRPQFCSRCGLQGNIEGHHHKGYEKEHWLDVVWLCQECHLREHDNLITFQERKESA
jgi:hypothetical protein